MNFRDHQPIVRVYPNGRRILCIYISFVCIVALEDYKFSVTMFNKYSMGDYSYDKQTCSELKRSLKIVESSFLSECKEDILRSMTEYRKEKLKRILK